MHINVPVQVCGYHGDSRSADHPGELPELAGVEAEHCVQVLVEPIDTCNNNMSPQNYSIDLH